MVEASWLSAVLVMTVVLVYYGGIGPKLTSLARPLAQLFKTKRLSVSELQGVLRLFLAALFQAAFAAILGSLLAGTLHDIFNGVSPTLLLLGGLVGLGELALGSFLCHVLVRMILVERPDSNPHDIRQWVAMSRAGWMQTYLKTIEVAPLPVSLSLTVAYVSFEEVVFRGILITFFLPLGEVWAVVLSTLAFATVQAFQMPGWRNAIFPVTGAVVMGVVHGALFVAVPDLGPLIVAHAMFFVVAVL